MICTGLGDDESDGGSGDDLLIADYPHRFARGNDTLIGGEGNDTIAQFDIDGTLLGAGFEVAQDQIHLITGTGTAQDYSLQDTDQGSVLTWGSSQILIYGVSEDDLGFFDIVMDQTWT